MNSKLLLFFLLLASLAVGQQSSISIIHFEGTADKVITAHSEVNDIFLDTFNDFFEPGHSRRTAILYNIDVGNRVQFLFGIDHHEKSNRHTSEDVSVNEIFESYSGQYNGTEILKTKYVDKYVSVPLGLQYTFKRGAHYNIYASSLIKPQRYYMSAEISKGFDTSGDRVYFERKNSVKNWNNEFHITAEVGLGIALMLTEKISLLGEINGDYSVTNVLDPDSFYKEHWYTGNVGLGLSYNFLKP